MPDDSGQLSLIVGREDERRMDEQRSARQRECVDILVGNQVDAKGEIGASQFARVLRLLQTVQHGVQIGVHLGVMHHRHFLLHLGNGFLTELNILLRRK